jgi:hypothetical protein
MTITTPAETPLDTVQAAAKAIHRLTCPDGGCYQRVYSEDIQAAKAALDAAAPALHAQGAAAERERICAWLDEVAGQATADAVLATDPLLRPFVGMLTAAVRSTITGVAELLRNPGQVNT